MEASKACFLSGFCPSEFVVMSEESDFRFELEGGATAVEYVMWSTTVKQVGD